MRLIVVVLIVLWPLLLSAQRIPRRAVRSQRTPESVIHAQQHKLDQVFRHVADSYVDPVDLETQTEAAIRAMLSELDPHSAYLTAEEMARARESFNGAFSGIGIEFGILRDTLIVAYVLHDSPAERAGLLPNDRIVRIDTLPVVGLSRERAPELLRGAKGSKVHLEVVRQDTPERLHVEAIRSRIPIHTVDAAYLAAERTGYIKVNRFGHTTMEEFKRAFASLGEVDALILDLRGNSGGLLGQAVELAGFFLPRGTRIVSTEGRAVPSTPLCTTRDGDFIQGQVVVLIDEESASGSEIVAGALQDWDRAWIIGRPSFGKGLVQRQFPLQDGSAIRLTIARYHTPSGRIIQRPYQPGHRKEYYRSHHQRRFLSPDSLTLNLPVYKTLRLGRNVYGGGGILPDQLIPADTTSPSPYLIELIDRGLVSQFGLDYLAHHRNELLVAYPTVEHFEKGFDPSDQLVDDLIQYADGQGIPCHQALDDRTQKWLRLRLRCDLARRLYGMEAAVRIMNHTEDVAYMSALEWLKAHPDHSDSDFLPEN